MGLVESVVATACVAVVSSLVALVVAGTAPRTATRESIEDARKQMGLDATRINWGVTGATGQGKSSLINAVRGMHPRTHAEAAPVGVNECTMQVKHYPFGDVLPVATLVDMPGAGTPKFPADTYFDKMRLDCYDAVVVVTSTRFTTFDQLVIDELTKHKVPYFLVRTKIDQDIDSEAEESGKSAEETLSDIREDLTRRVPGSARVYLVSTRRANRKKYDMAALKQAVVVATEANRKSFTA